MKALILTNGDYGDYSFCQVQEDYDFVICADNGMSHARELHIRPDWIIGDFDSCNGEDLGYFKECGVEVVELAREKDETDTEVALDFAISHGAKHIHIYGGVGTRFDHSLGNVHLLYKAYKQDVLCTLFSAHNTINLIGDQIQIEGVEGDLVSLLPFSGRVSGVTTSGLAYVLTDGVFEMGQPYGVSNYLIQKQAEVRIKQGLLLVIKARD